MRQGGLGETAGLTQDFHFLEGLEEVTRDRRENEVCAYGARRWLEVLVSSLPGREIRRHVCACMCAHMCVGT